MNKKDIAQVWSFFLRKQRARQKMVSVVCLFRPQRRRRENRVAAPGATFLLGDMDDAARHCCSSLLGRRRYHMSGWVAVVVENERRAGWRTCCG